MGDPASLLVVDVGTSGVRSAVVRPDGTVDHVHHRSVLPDTPAPGMVEVDAEQMADAVLATASQALEVGGPVGAVGIANQRATTIVWERATGRPVAPGIGWQDLRTVGTCLMLQEQGIHLAPNVSATKIAWILDQVDPDRRRAEDHELCAGTVDTWVAWILSGGSGGDALHLTDASNAGVTGLIRRDASGWDEKVASALKIPLDLLPRIVDSSGVCGQARALAGAPPICGIVGDQQGSLIGQGATRPGLAKATFGTGGMLDQCTGSRPGESHASTRSDTSAASAGPGSPTPTVAPGALGPGGTFPIIAWQRAGHLTWGVEAAMLSAGTCVEWLRDDLGLLDEVAQSAEVAVACEDTGDVWFVPALFGLGSPVWDFGARGTVLGLTRGSGRPELVRAVLRGIAQRGADLLEAAEADSGLTIEGLRVDGGMSANPVFVAELAEATGRLIELAPEIEATTRGAGYLAGLAIGTWKDEAELADAWQPRERIEPRGSESTREAQRTRWLEARARSEGTIPELSGISF